MRYSDAANHIFRIWDKIIEYRNEIPEDLYTEVSRECSLFVQELMETYKANETDRV